MAKVRRDRWGHWRWIGSHVQSGYGNFSMGGRDSTMGAHRAAWLLFRGDIPEGYDVHHICRIRDCVCPQHLELLTTEEHHSVVHGAGTNKRIDVCKHGHPMDGDNVRWHTRKDGYRARVCRACNVERLRRMRAAGYVAPARRE